MIGPDLVQYCTPFNIENCEELLKKHGYTIIPNITDSVRTAVPHILDDKKMEYWSFVRLLFLTHGNPKYIVDYVLSKSSRTMDSAISAEYREIENQQNFFADPQQLCRAIIDSFRGNDISPLLDMGVAYSLKLNDKAYLAHYEHSNTFWVFTSMEEWHT